MQKTILIIDPNLLKNVSSLPDLLKSSDRKVFVATDEAKAMAILKTHKIDVILLEPLMGSACLIDFSIERMRSVENTEIGGTGLVLLNNIKKEANAVKSKVILYTVVSSENCLKAGFSKEICHYRKPKLPQVLIQEINRR